MSAPAPPSPSKTAKPYSIAAFTDMVNNSSIGLSGFVTLAIFIFIGVLLYNFGAARLAYCAFTRMGYGGGGAFLMSIIAWFFSGIYYPIHALFLTSECSVPQFVGGRRRR